MNSSPKYRILLRSIYTAVIGSGLSPKDLRSLAEELRRGRLPDELAYMVDQACQHFLADYDEADDQGLIANAEVLIKERKLGRSGVVSILQSLGAPKPASGASIRKMLVDFNSSVPPTRFRKLIDVLESSSDSDAFLAGISSTRK